MEGRQCRGAQAITAHGDSQGPAVPADERFSDLSSDFLIKVSSVEPGRFESAAGLLKRLPGVGSAAQAAQGPAAADAVKKQGRQGFRLIDK
jgi:hypothetical protein